MAKLSNRKRRRLPKSAFAGPGRSYPVNDKAHAKAALLDAGIAAKKGRMSKAEKKRIDSKARKVLARGKGKKR